MVSFNVYAAAKASGIPANTLTSRMKRRGLTLEEAVAVGPAKCRNRSPRVVDDERTPDQYFIDALRHARGLAPLYENEE